MPIQRYEGGSTPFQRISPAGYQAQAQLANNFTDRLNEWNSRVYEVGKLDADYKGREQAVNDLASGEPAKLEKGYSFYANAYNEVSKAAYNAQVETDLRMKAEEYAKNSANDPEQFKAMFSEYTKTTMNGIQEPGFKALYNQTAMKTMATYSTNLIKEKFKQQRENDIKAIDANLKDLELSYESSFSNDDFDSTSESLAKITALMEAKVKAGEMSDSMIPLEIKRIVNNGVKTKIMTELDNSIQSGESDYVQRFMQSDIYKQMPINERTALSKKMFEHIDNTFKATTEAFDSSVNLSDKMSKKTAMDLSTDILTGKDISNSTLDELLAEKKLLPAQYKEVVQLREDMQSGSIADDENAVMDYEISIEYVNPRTIAYDSRLTSKTKQMLIGRAVSIQRQERADVRTANALSNYKKTMGISPVQYGVDYAKGNLDIDDASEKQREVLKLKTTVLKKVERGEIDITEFPDAMAVEVDSFKKRNKDNSDSRKYDREFNEYNEKLKLYNKQNSSTFGKLKSKVGLSSEAPVAPKRPDNYIPKNRRVVQ